MSQQTPLRLPDSMMRDDIGPYMKGVREYFNLSQQDVSERLHIRHRYIDAIEHGQLEQMPGRAYAKGYVHTYAEFLGLDADQVVEICFGPEPVREVQQHFVPAPARRGKRTGNMAAWRSLAVLSVVGAVFLLGVVQFFSANDDEAPQVAPVTDVPETMLSEMRTMVMPGAGNNDCLGNETALGCIVDSGDWQAMVQLSQPAAMYMAAVDFAPPAEVEVTPAAVPAEEPAVAPKDDNDAAVDDAVMMEDATAGDEPPPAEPAKPAKPKEEPKEKPKAAPAKKEAAKPKPAPRPAPKPAAKPAAKPAPKAEPAEPGLDE